MINNTIFQNIYANKTEERNTYKAKGCDLQLYTQSWYEYQVQNLFCNISVGTLTCRIKLSKLF